MSSAVNLVTSVDAHPIVTLFIHVTSDIITGSQAEIHSTRFTITAVGVRLTNGATSTVKAELSSTALTIAIYHTIAVIIDPVTDIKLIGPTFPACVTQSLVDATVTIVIDPITDLFLEDGYGLT